MKNLSEKVKKRWILLLHYMKTSGLFFNKLEGVWRWRDFFSKCLCICTHACAFHKRLILVFTLLLYKKQIKNNLFPVRIIITSLFYNISLVHRKSALLNSLSACAVTCCWKCFDGEIAISWPYWKRMGVAFIGLLITTSKKLPFFV